MEIRLMLLDFRSMIMIFEYLLRTWGDVEMIHLPEIPINKKVVT